MKSYYFAETSSIERLNRIVKEFAREGWIVDGTLIVFHHDNKPVYLQKLMYNRTWGEYIREVLCLG
jgi:hypothetical protein